MSCSVYVAFAESDEALYVGMSRSALIRAHQHGSDGKAWWEDVAYIEVIHFDGRDAALDHEAYLIARLNPKHNQVRPKCAPRGPISLREYTEARKASVALLDEELVAHRLNKGLARKQAAQEIGVPVAVLASAERGEQVRAFHAKLIADFYEIAVTDFRPVSEEAA